MAGIIVRWGLAARPAPEPAETAPRALLAAARLIAGDPRLRLLVAAAWLAGFYGMPQALAVPYADGLGAGSAVAGVLMAAVPLGTLAGVTVFARYVPPRARLTLLGPLAVLTSVPLVFAAFDPGVAGSVVLWTLIGVFSAYQVTANAEFVRAVPDHRRGQAVGLAGSGLVAAQGLGIAAGGLLAELTDPAAAIAIAGVGGVLAAVPIAVAWRPIARESDARAG